MVLMYSVRTITAGYRADEVLVTLLYARKAQPTTLGWLVVCGLTEITILAGEEDRHILGGNRGREGRSGNREQKTGDSEYRGSYVRYACHGAKPLDGKGSW